MRFRTVITLGLLISTGMSCTSVPMKMNPHVFRLAPGEDLKTSLESYIQEKKINAGIILTTVGSLTHAHLRYANQKQGTELTGPFEIVSLVGTLSANQGSHLHLSLSDSQGKTIGGHLLKGCKVYTTAEIALIELPELLFKREFDPKSGYPELKVVPLYSE